MKASTAPAYRSPCGWNSLLPPRVANRMLEDNVDCDVIIVGAGYTGLAAARRFAEREPGLRVTVLDSSTVGEGNPGRNSGFLLNIALAGDANPAEVRRMRECNRLIGAAMADLCRLVEQHSIDCSLERTGTYRGAAGATGVAALEAYRNFLDAARLEYETLDRQQMRKRLGTGFYRIGLYSPDCYLVQPAALIRGLAESLPQGVSIYENTPVLSMARAGDNWVARTSRATATAPRLVIANNAFCKRLGIGKSRIVAMYTCAALTEPLPDLPGGDGQWGLLPSHRLGSTLRRTRDSRLLVRSLYGYEREADGDGVEVMLRRALLRRFPQARDLRFAAAWSGATGFTLNGAPLWGEYEPGLYVSAGCNGGGVVKGTLFGAAIADLACGRDIPDIPRLFGTPRWMPPEPFRRLGFHLISGIERRKGLAEI